MVPNHCISSAIIYLLGPVPLSCIVADSVLFVVIVLAEKSRKASGAHRVARLIPKLGN